MSEQAINVLGFPHLRFPSPELHWNGRYRLTPTSRAKTYRDLPNDRVGRGFFRRASVALGSVLDLVLHLCRVGDLGGGGGQGRWLRLSADRGCTGYPGVHGPALVTGDRQACRRGASVVARGRGDRGGGCVGTGSDCNEFRGCAGRGGGGAGGDRVPVRAGADGRRGDGGSSGSDVQRCPAAGAGVATGVGVGGPNTSCPLMPGGVDGSSSQGWCPDNGFGWHHHSGEGDGAVLGENEKRRARAQGCSATR